MALGRRKRRDRDFFGRPIPWNHRIAFRRDVLAEALWEYGEEELAERTLTLTDDELHEVQLLSVWHRLNAPDPPTGPKMTNGRVMSRAMIEYTERGSRDTKRMRRRTREDGYDAAYLESLLRGDPRPNTPAEDGLDVHD